MDKVLGSSFLLFFLALTMPRSTFGVFQFSNEAGNKFEGWESDVCTPRFSKTVQSLSLFEAEFVVPEKDICLGDDASKLKYGGKIVAQDHLRAVCNIEAKPGFILTIEKYVLDANLSAFIYFYGSSLSGDYAKQRVVPGIRPYTSSYPAFSKDFPVFDCSVPTKKDGSMAELGFLEGLLDGENNNGSLSLGYVNLTIDSNPWSPYFDSPINFIYFRFVCGSLFLYFGGKGLYFGWTTRKDKKREFTNLLLVMEGVSLNLIGLHLFISGFLNDFNGIYPEWLQFGFVSLLSGVSLCTSLLAGLIFHEINSSARKMKALKKSLLLTHRVKIFCAVLFFILLDLSSFVTKYLESGTQETAIAGEYYYWLPFFTAKFVFLASKVYFNQPLLHSLCLLLGLYT